MSEQDTFTPVFDIMLEAVGLSAAVVYGVVWRFAQMDSGTCTASQEKIAKRAGISVGNVRLHLSKLVEAGHLTKQPIKGKGVIYTPTLLNLSTHTAQIKRATPLKLSNKDTLLRDSLRDMDSDLLDFAIQATGIMPTQKDVDIILKWQRDGVLPEDITSAISWRLENGKPPVKYISQLDGGVNTSRLKRVQAASGNQKTERNQFGL